MRKVLIAACALIAVSAALATALFLFVDVNQFRGQIQAALQKQIGRQVALGQMNLQVIPLAIRVADVRIEEDPNFATGRPFATAKGIRVRIALLPLLRRELQVQSLTLGEPSIELVRNANRHWNYETIVTLKTGGSSDSLQLSTFAIENGKVSVSDIGVKNSRTEYDHIDMLLRQSAPGKPFHGKLTAHLDGSRKHAIELEGDGGPLQDKNTVFKGRLTIEDASAGAVQRFLNQGRPATLDGVLGAVADVVLSGSVMNVRGRMEMKKVRLQGKELSTPVRVEYDVQDNLTSGELRIHNVQLGVDRMPVTASGEVNTRTNALKAAIRTNGADLADVFTLAHLFGWNEMSGAGQIALDVQVAGTTESPTYSGSGRLQKAVLHLSSLAKPVHVHSASLRFDGNTVSLGDLALTLGSTNAKGQLSIHDFHSPEISFRLDADKVNGAELQALNAQNKQQPEHLSTVTGKGAIHIGTLTYNDFVFQNVQAECTLNGRSITLAPVTADLFGGKQTGSITVDGRTQPPTLNLNTKLERVDANQILSATTSLKRMLYGLLAAQGNASMRLASTEKDVARGLNGKLNLNLTNGRLAGINLLNEAASIAKFLGYARSNEGFTNIVQLFGEVAIRDGVAGTDNLRLILESGTVSATGTVDLVDQTLNMHLTTILDRDTSEKSGGSRIGGFLSTALANAKGELVIPAIVTGTLAQPRFAPDVGRVAEMKLKGGPGIGLVKPGTGRAVIDAITGKNPDTGQTPAGGILDILNSLKKKKAEQK